MHGKELILIMNTVNQWIEAYKTKTGATTQDIADALSISRVAFYRKRNGRSDFSLSQAKELANLMGIQVAQLEVSPFDLARHH